MTMTIVRRSAGTMRAELARELEARGVYVENPGTGAGADAVIAYASREQYDCGPHILITNGDNALPWAGSTGEIVAALFRHFDDLDPVIVFDDDDDVDVAELACRISRALP